VTTRWTSGSRAGAAARVAAGAASATAAAASAAMATLWPVTEILGWGSSFILVLTIAKQVHKQWRQGSSEGVSRWLFVGQLAASAGFTVYSLLVRNWVFVVTNALLLVNALLGLLIVLHHRRRAGARAPGAAATRPQAGAGRSRAGLPPPRTA
jgi:uncharacterized protein with PQ loop repeat